MRTYSSTLKQFFEFAAECGIRPTSVTVFDIVNYISWQAERGRVHADNLQPYLSSINKFLQQTGCEPVAQGPLVNDAVSGLRALQHMQSARDSRLYIPASVMLKIFRAAQQLAKSASTKKDLELLRSMVASITAFYFFHRSDTDHALLADDLVVDASFITLRERRVKGHSSDRDRRVVRLPIAEVHEFCGARRAVQTPPPPSRPQGGVVFVVAYGCQAKKRPDGVAPASPRTRRRHPSSRLQVDVALPSTWGGHIRGRYQRPARKDPTLWRVGREELRSLEVHRSYRAA